MFLITLVVFIVIFSLLILIHELGHFWAAKRAGVKVEEFGFGLPPRIWGVKKGETLYSINWIPFGGFVRMLGEDTSKGKRSKRSINNQPLRVQAWIVSAGVVMNLLLAFVLLTFGFLVGIEPLIVDEKDFNAAVMDGTMVLEPGLVILESDEPYNTVVYDGKDLDIRSFEPGDRILTADGEALVTLDEWETLVAGIEETGKEVFVGMDRADGSGGAEYLSKEHLEQIKFAPLYLNRFVYIENPGSLFASYLNDQDVLMQVDGAEIVTEDSLFEALSAKKSVSLSVFRPGVGEMEFNNVELTSSSPILAYVMPDSPAAESGLRVGDQILRVNQTEVFSSSDLAGLTEQSFLAEGQATMNYEIERSGERLSFDVQLDEDGLIGILLSDPVPYFGQLSLYPTFTLHSLIEVKKESHGLFKAPVHALGEMWRLGKLTAVMFVNVLGNFLTGNAVPDGVAGPVGIAQMTALTIQAGFSALIRFVALLSLSLGVINILPIPALDGGRLVFIIFQAATGRKPNPKFEGLIHNAGFFFLILFLVYVTFNDVLNLF